MIYELREYVAAPGKTEALHRRFAEGTLALFAKHGITVVGFWTTAADGPPSTDGDGDGDSDAGGNGGGDGGDGPGSRIVYVVRFADEAAQEQAWAAFQGDPEWQRLKSSTETGGPLAARMTSSTLTAPAYWPYDTTVERP